MSGDVRRFRKQVEVMLRTVAPREKGEKGVAGVVVSGMIPWK